MANVGGRIGRMRIYEEEGRTDWPLALSKICWFFICVLFPLSFFRLLNGLFGVFTAVAGVFLLLLLSRLLGPLNLVLLDELLARVFPSLRTAVRLGRVRVYDFRVQRTDGTQIACLLRGELLGGSPMQGDVVELEGEFRGGSFHVRNGRNKTTRSAIVPRRSHSGWILFGTLTLMAFFAAYLAGAFDEWITPWLVELLVPLLESE